MISYRSADAVSRSQTREIKDSPLPIDETDGHCWDDLARKILLLVAVRRRHQRHQPCDPRVDEWVPKSPRECWYEHLAVRRGLEETRETSEEDAGVGSDSWLRVGLGFGEVTQEVVVEDAIIELGVKSQSWGEGRG